MARTLPHPSCVREHAFLDATGHRSRRTALAVVAIAVHQKGFCPLGVAAGDDLRVKGRGAARRAPTVASTQDDPRETDLTLGLAPGVELCYGRAFVAG
jgi:hypothetical protein